MSYSVQTKQGLEGRAEEAGIGNQILLLERHFYFYFTFPYLDLRDMTIGKVELEWCISPSSPCTSWNAHSAPPNITSFSGSALATAIITIIIQYY